MVLIVNSSELLAVYVFPVAFNDGCALEWLVLYSQEMPNVL
jgi:hypothetical protein